MSKMLMKGNEAIAEAAIRAGLDCYFAYPITPQSELMEYLAKNMPLHKKVFLQAESEIAAINMVYGAAGCGKRTMTSSSSPGISLKQEGISYIAGAELPCVIVNIQRGGPGLGSITCEQADYFQATKGGGHGNYRLIVLAPNSVQEAADLTMQAFDIADRYRNPVMILGDAHIGQMMEPISFKAASKRRLKKKWATTGCINRKPNIITSIYIAAKDLEAHNWKLDDKYKLATKQELRYEMYKTKDAKFIVVAYGITSRIVKSAIDIARAQGIKVGLFRPISLYPFPYKVLKILAKRIKSFLVCELSTGQMVEDVTLGVNGKRPVYFHGRAGGGIPTPKEIADKIIKIAKQKRKKTKNKKRSKKKKRAIKSKMKKSKKRSSNKITSKSRIAKKVKRRKRR